MEIQSSGKFRTFETGARRDIDESKGRMDLLPWAAIMEVSKHSAAGAAKYGEHNVDLGIPTHSLLDSAMRHTAKYLEGWDDEPHLLAAAWNLLWAVEMTITHPEQVDTPWNRTGGASVITDIGQYHPGSGGCAGCRYVDLQATDYPCCACSHGDGDGETDHHTERFRGCIQCQHSALMSDQYPCSECLHGVPHVGSDQKEHFTHREEERP